MRALRLHIGLATVFKNGLLNADRLTDDIADLVEHLILLLHNVCDRPRVPGQLILIGFQIEGSLVRGRVAGSEEDHTPHVAERSPVTLFIRRRNKVQPNHLPERDQFQDSYEHWQLDYLQAVLFNDFFENILFVDNTFLKGLIKQVDNLLGLLTFLIHASDALVHALLGSLEAYCVF